MEPLEPRLFERRDNELQPVEWGDGYRLQSGPWGRRLMCSTCSDPIEFLLRLIRRYTGPFRVTYILEDHRGAADIREGRYHSPRDLAKEQIEFFLHEFRDYLATDGRHHLIVTCRSTSGAVVYDQHNWFFVYGGIDRLVEELRLEGFAETSYELGEHGHFVGNSSAELRRLLEFWHWTWSELEATDLTPGRTRALRFLRAKLRAWWFDRTRHAPD